jgi:hypothetical protein
MLRQSIISGKSLADLINAMIMFPLSFILVK